MGCLPDLGVKRIRRRRKNKEAGGLPPQPPSYQSGQDPSQGHGEAQPNEQRLTFSELQEKYEAFEKQANLSPESQNIIDYVRGLRSSRKTAEESLGTVRRNAESLLKELKGDEFARGFSQGRSTSDIVKFIFDGNKDQSNLLKNNQEDIRRLNHNVHWFQEENKQLEHNVEILLNNNRILEKKHEQELDRERSHREQELNRERSLHEQELNQERSHHEQGISRERSQRDEAVRILTEQYICEKKALESEHENRVNELRGDIRTLQEAAMDHVDRFIPRPDSELRGQFKQLKSSVRSVARSPWDIGSQTLRDSTHIEAFIQTAPEQHHKYALESKLWSILAEGIFATPFKVLGDYGNCFFTSWCLVHPDSRRPSDPVFNWPPLSTATEKWRATTFEMLARLLSANNPMIKESRDQNANNVFQTLCMTLSLVSSQNQQSELWRIVRSAVDLAVDMGEQRCRLQLFSPGINEAVLANSETYENVNLGSSTGSTKGTVKLVVSPGLKKTGDGEGKSFDKTLDLCPASLYLANKRDSLYLG